MLGRQGCEIQMFGRGPGGVCGRHEVWTPPLPRARFWQRFSRRSVFPARAENADDAARRTRLAERRGHDRGPDRHQRAALAVAWSLCALWSGCARVAEKTLEQTYRDAWLTLERGELTAATSEAEAGLRRIRPSNTDWYWRFTALKAEVLLRQGLSDDALALLQPELPPSLATSDVAVWRKLTQGAAAAYSLKFPES